MAATLAWSWASFHAAVFLLLPLALVHVLGNLGDLVQGLDTFAGAGLYLALWGLTWWVHRGALAGASAALADSGEHAWAPQGMGLLHGAAIGAGFALVAGAGIAVATFAPLFLVFALVAALFGAAFGAAVGFAFALLATALFTWAVRIADRWTT